MAEANVIFGSDALDTRVELYTTSGQYLHMRVNDLRSQRIAVAFDIKAEGMYLEESGTGNAEFPDNDGVFHLGATPLSRWKVCGQSAVAGTPSNWEIPAGTSLRPQFNSTQSSSRSSWNVSSNPAEFRTSTWAPATSPLNMIAPGSGKKRTRPPVANIKRTIPYVTLGIDKTKKSVCMEDIINNVYIKVAEDSVSPSAIIEAAALKIITDPEELVILDAKFIPVERDQTDIEYWKVPSRRFYIANLREYTAITDSLKSKRNRKFASNVSTRSFSFEAAETDVEQNIQEIKASVEKIADDVQCLKQTLMYQSRIFGDHLECKICKGLPISPVFVSCCKQVLGCRICFNLSIEENNRCPLCRQEEPHTIDFTEWI